MNELLSVRSLFIEFVGRKTVTRVVKNLEFTLREGETLAIVGESGSGKSVSSLSFLQLLNNKRSNVTGQVILNYKGRQYDLIDLPQKSIAALRGHAVSMIFQEPMSALNPVLTCGRQVAEVMLIHGTAAKSNVKKKVLALFKEVELPRVEEMYSSYPHQLSGGQQQRVMIAMALANKPVLLIADEPTTALDPEVQNNILSLINRLQKKSNMAMIFISHDLDVVKKVADHIIVMQKGEIMEQGPSSQVLNHPQHPYTKGLLNCKPGEHMRGYNLPTVKDFLLDPDFKPVTRPPKAIADEALIKAENITVAYKSGGLLKKTTVTKAIDQVSFKLRKGETLGIIGPSGCGKTTTGRVLAGWIKPTAGKVLFKNKTVISPDLDTGKSWARKVQLIFQDPFGSLNPTIRIGDAIAEPMLVHNLVKNNREAKKRVEALLGKVGLSAVQYNRYPHEFSGGQRQRIVIARALAVEPEVLICDESVAALDVSVQSQVLNLLNDLQAELGLSYIFISHDHNVIHYFCDRVLEMSGGKIAAEKTLRPADSMPHKPLESSIPAEIRQADITPEPVLHTPKPETTIAQPVPESTETFSQPAEEISPEELPAPELPGIDMKAVPEAETENPELPGQPAPEEAQTKEQAPHIKTARQAQYKSLGDFLRKNR